MPQPEIKRLSPRSDLGSVNIKMTTSGLFTKITNSTKLKKLFNFGNFHFIALENHFCLQQAN